MKKWIEIRDGKRYLVKELPPQRPKEQDADMSRFHVTKFPFAATINGRPVTVWPDWIEEEDPTTGLL